MKPEHITDEEWAAMDARTQEWMTARARPGEVKTVSFGDTEIEIRAGWCPCDCHTWMWECEEADCRCCRNTCT